jgi:hypothetical protein
MAVAAVTCTLGSTEAARADPQTQPLAPGQHFTIDPVADGVLIAGGAGFAGLLSLVLSTGEIRATAPGPESNLLSFDQTAVTQTIDPHAALLSDIGLYSSIGFAVLDPLLSGFRDGWDAALVDAVMYAETISITEMLTDITKIAVRRPRPIDYVNCPSGTNLSTSCNSNTDLQLSFFSGHASTVASIGATATYLAFQRSPRSPRPCAPGTTSPPTSSRARWLARPSAFWFRTCTGTRRRRRPSGLALARPPEGEGRSRWAARSEALSAGARRPRIMQRWPALSTAIIVARVRLRGSIPGAEARSGQPHLSTRSRPAST